MMIKIYGLLAMFSILSCTTKENQSKENKFKTEQKSAIEAKNVVMDDIIGTDNIILEEIEGYINADKLKDKVILYRGIDDKQGLRTLMVLLKTETSYNLLAKNSIIMGPEYSKDDYKINDTEDISIEKHKLIVDIFCQGPCGNVLMEFSYSDNKLMLSHFETYDMGAGGHIQTEFNSSTKMAVVTTTNTMKEDMPTEVKEKKLDYKKSLEFSKFSRDELSESILKTTESE